MGARHGAQNSAVWADDSAVVLLAGIEASDPGKGLAKERSTTRLTLRSASARCSKSSRMVTRRSG